MHAFVSMSVVRMCSCMSRAAEGSSSLRAGVAGTWELPGVDARNKFSSSARVASPIEMSLPPSPMC